MIYVVMRFYKQSQFTNSVAAFDNHVDACKYADHLRDTDYDTYSYRVDSVHLNPKDQNA